MKSEFAASRIFLRGAARFSDLVYIISKAKVLLEEDIAHTSLICVDRDDWADGVDTDWDATAIAVAKSPSEKAILVGEDGDVATYVGGKSKPEKISPAPVLIRSARTIEGLVYACGMKRQVFKRVGERKWIDMSAPFPTADEEVGFEALDGYSSKEIYAAGWRGEIWQYDGTAWTDRGSPTNLILSAVCCAPDNLVYIGGQLGVLLSGRNSTWEIVQWDEGFDLDIWDLCWFQDKLYIAAISGLFTLKGNDVVAVDFGDIRPPNCYSLTTADGVLWSIGRDDVVSFDGKKWQLYE